MTSDEFLSYLQQTYKNEIAENEHAPQELEQIIKNRFQKNDLEFSRDLEKVVIMLRDEIMLSLSPLYLEKIKNKLSIGYLQSGIINAVCTKHRHQEVYAILLNQGLLMYLNKIVKFSIAGFFTESVIYCNRMDKNQLNKSILISYMIEVAENYKKYGAPYGPIIQLDDENIKTQSHYLHIQELFILCHELAHYFNGDLDDDNNLRQFLNFADVDELVENKNHSMEFAADEKGYELLLLILKNAPSEKILPPLVVLFNSFYFLNSEASDKHPDPLSRVINIIKKFYGEDNAKKMAQSYNNMELLGDESFFRMELL